MNLPVLVTLRGNSASGKSSIAARLRAEYGRGVALVGQDVLRRDVLRELPVPGGANIELIDLVARHCLRRGFHTVVEGILEARVYGDIVLDAGTALRETVDIVLRGTGLLESALRPTRRTWDDPRPAARWR